MPASESGFPDAFTEDAITLLKSSTPSPGGLDSGNWGGDVATIFSGSATPVVRSELTDSHVSAPGNADWPMFNTPESVFASFTELALSPISSLG